MTEQMPSGLSSLTDLRVIELGVWVAAPSAAAILADWGADVIKVEAPAGDPMRQVFASIGFSDDVPNPAFSLDNRGKRSVVLNLRDEADRASLEELLATADVFVSNLRPDALDGLGLEAEATLKRHPHLVYCSVSGYGLRGEDRNRSAYDVGAFWARSGLSSQLSDSEGVPLNVRGGIGDHISGLAVLSGILGAVLEQRHTGRGRVVEVSLLRTGAYILGWDLSLQSGLGKVAGSEPRHSIQTPLMNSYQASDGKWFFFMGLEAGRHVERIYRALGRSDLLDDPRFANASALRKNRTEVITILDEIIAQEPLAVWAERFDQEDVWWAPVQRPAEVLADLQLRINDGLFEIEDDSTGETRLAVNSPISFSDLPVDRAATALTPRLGEHTEEVLAELAAGHVRRRGAGAS